MTSYVVARPQALSPALKARIAASPASLRTLQRELAAEGVVVSTRTIQRTRKASGASAAPATFPPAPPSPGGAVAALRARPPRPAVEYTTTLEGELAALRSRKATIQAALARFDDNSLALDGRAALSHGRLLVQLDTVTRAIIELTPRPPEEQYAPVEGAALSKLLARAAAAADADEVQALRDQLASQARAIATLRAVIDEGD